MSEPRATKGIVAAGLESESLNATVLDSEGLYCAEKKVEDAMKVKDSECQREYIARSAFEGNRWLIWVSIKVEDELEDRAHDQDPEPSPTRTYPYLEHVQSGTIEVITGTKSKS